MSVSYPLQLPSNNARSVRFRMMKLTSAHVSPYTFQEQIHEFPAERWAATIELPPIKGRANAEAWIAFLAALRGQAGTFEMGDPLGQSVMGTMAGGPAQVYLQHEAQSKTLEIDGLTPNSNGVLLAGDYIQFTLTGKKYIHKVLTDADTDGSGRVELDIWPVLRVQVANNTDIVTTACKGTFRLATPDQGWDADYLRIYGIEFEAMEAL